MKPEDKDPNEGEGSRTAARRYNQDVRKFVAGDHAGEAARDAADALDGPEGPYLKDAEARAKRVGKPSLLDRLKGVYRRARNSL